MCVRKTADTGGTPTMQGSGLTSSSSSTAKTSRRHKPLKAMRSRGGAGSSKQSETSEKKASGTTVEVDCTVKVRDDGDGHLIYHKGDLVDQRCKSWLVYLLESVWGPAVGSSSKLPGFIVPWVFAASFAAINTVR